MEVVMEPATVCLNEAIQSTGQFVRNKTLDKNEGKIWLWLNVFQSHREQQVGFLKKLGDFRQLSSVWIYCMMNWLIMLTYAWWFASGRLGRAQHLGLAPLLRLIAKSISFDLCTLGFWRRGTFPINIFGESHSCFVRQWAVLECLHSA